MPKPTKPTLDDRIAAAFAKGRPKYVAQWELLAEARSKINAELQCALETLKPRGRTANHIYAAIKLLKEIR